MSQLCVTVLIVNSCVYPGVGQYNPTVVSIATQLIVNVLIFTQFWGWATRYNQIAVFIGHKYGNYYTQRCEFKDSHKWYNTQARESIGHPTLVDIC